MIRNLREFFDISFQYCFVDDEFFEDNEFVEDIPVLKMSDNRISECAVIVLGIQMFIKDITVKEQEFFSLYPNCRFLNLSVWSSRITYSICRLDALFFINNYKQFSWTYQHLADDGSKRLFCAFINSCISGSYLDMQLFTRHLSKIDYDIDFLLCGKEPDLIVECGAFDGKSAMEIMAYLDTKECSLYAFEPDPNNYINMKNHCSNDKRIIPLNKGTYSSNSEMYFVSDSSSSYLTNTVPEVDYTPVSVITIDEEFKDQKISTIIMDIEGAELEALKGARDHIIKDKPSLAIRVYHKPEDLITIPQFLDEIMPEDRKYNLYLRHDNWVDDSYLETTLYAK